MPAISYSNPDYLCPGRTIFVVIIDPAGPFMLYIFGLAGPFMHPDHKFLYSSYEPSVAIVFTELSYDLWASSVAICLILSFVKAGLPSCMTKTL